jgi:hypothetical protein
MIGASHLPRLCAVVMTLAAVVPGAVHAQAPLRGRAPDAAALARWAAHGFDAEAARAWTEIGVEPAEARQWREAGIEFAGWANQWKGEGFNAAEAGVWARNRVNVYTAADFRTSGFSVPEATGWISAGVRSALRAREFRDRGFSAADAGEWWRLEFFPEEAATWHAAGFKAPEAQSWKYGEKETRYTGRSKMWWQTVYPVEWARQWKAAGFTSDEARRARAYEVRFPEADAWRKAGFGFDEGVAWKDAGFTLLDAAVRRAEGLTPVEAEARAAENWDGAEVITAFHSDITLRPDASVDVIETIVFRKGPAGAVDRCFPRRLPATVSLRRTVSSSDSGWPTYAIASATHDGQPAAFTVDRASDGEMTVCIGGGSAPLPERVHTFTLHYTTNDRLVEFYDHDLLYVSVTEARQTVPILRATATVRLPKGADTVWARGYAGPPDRTYFVAEVSDTAGGDAVAYTVARPLKGDMQFAVAVALTRGFARPGLLQRARHLDHRAGRIFSSLAVFAAGLAAALGYFVVAWRRVGRDPKKRVVVPIYEPPDGVSPALARYLATGRRVDARSVAATVVRLAQSGALAIRERAGRYRIEKTAVAPAGCADHEVAFFDTVFAGTTSIAPGSADGARRVRDARRVLREALRSQRGRDVVPNSRHVWPSLVLMLGGGYGAARAADPASIEIGYLLALAACIAIATVVFRQLLKAPAPHVRERMDRIEGFRRFLESSYRASSALRGSVAMDSPPSIAAHLPYAIALGIDADRASILDRGQGWYAGQSGGFSVTDFTSSFGRLTPRAVKA